MTDAPNGASAWHRALDAAAAQQAEENARAADLRKRQLESGTIPAPSGEPCSWQRAIDTAEARAKEVAAEDAETSRDYYARARRNAGIVDHA